MDNLEKNKLPIDVMRGALGASPADKSLSWDKLGEYAKYLNGFYKETANISKNKNVQADHDIIMDFMMAHDSNEDTTNLTKESIFRSIVDARMTNDKARNRDDILRQEIDSIGALHKRVSDHSRVGLECLRLSKFAPKEIKDKIEAILKSNSQYLDRTALLNYLIKRDWTSEESEEFTANLFMDQTKIIQDVQEGNVL